MGQHIFLRIFTDVLFSGILNETTCHSARIRMGRHVFLWISICILFSGIFIATACPSPPITYASVGDNITLCWKLSLGAAKISQLVRITVLALKRPGELVMEKIASVNRTGHFLGVHHAYHSGLYKDKATVFADLPAGMFYLKITDYTSSMENVYCPLYELFVHNDIAACHSQALLLRNVDLREVSLQTTAMMATETTIKTTTASNTSAESTTEGPTTVEASPSKTALIVVSCLFVIALIGAIAGFLLFYQSRKHVQPGLMDETGPF